MRLLVSFLVLIIVMCCSPDYEKVLIVQAGDHALINTPVYVDLENQEFDENIALCLKSGHEVVPGQIETLPDSRQRLWWVVNLEAGESASYGLIIDDICQNGHYRWERVGDFSTRLLFNGQAVIQYEHPVFDYDDIEETKKPYHHVFEPSGNQFITKGPGGLYAHHRGIYYGYNHVYVGDSDQRIDIWHAARGERSEHAEVIREYAGPVMGGHEVKIFWKDHDGNSFIEETRDVRVFRQENGEILIDFHSILKAVDEPVRLEGDRQHAGVQFRAAQYVADNRDQTKFIRPAYLSHVSSTYEIDGEDMYDLPWNAFYFKINGKPFTVTYMSDPSNPDNAEMSERLYGRFGEFFPHYLTRENPLVVNYRFWVTEGDEPSVESIDRRYQVYANPATVVQPR